MILSGVVAEMQDTQSMGASGTAGGVLLNNGLAISTASLSAADSSSIAYSVWVKYPDEDARRNSWVWISDAAGTAANWSAPWWDFSQGIQGANDGKLGVNFQDNPQYVSIRSFAPRVPIAQWVHYLVGFHSDGGSTPKNRISIYCNRVSVATIYTDQTVPLIPTINGKTFHVGSYNYNDTLNSEMADFWFAPGQNILEADGSISAATLNKFVTPDLKPVDLGANGQLPTGVAPAVYMHRDPSDTNPSNFATNRGTGGTFAVSRGALALSSSNP